MKLGYTIVYVPDVAESLAFFGAAFGLKTRFLHDSGSYGELETGETTLSFASHELGAMNFPAGFVRASDSKTPLGMEIALTTPDVAAAHASALEHGATELAAPKTKPWGQTVSWVRAPDGTLVELCTPMGAELLRSDAFIAFSSHVTNRLAHPGLGVAGSVTALHCFTHNRLEAEREGLAALRARGVHVLAPM